MTVGPTTDQEQKLLAWIRSVQDEAYDRGYKDAEKYYTNSCFYCGYAGEWSTWACDDCTKNNAGLKAYDD